MEMGGAHWLLVVGLLVVGLSVVEKIHEFSLHTNNMMGGIHPSIVYPTLPSRLMASNFCASTANSMGSSLKTSLQ